MVGTDGIETNQSDPAHPVAAPSAPSELPSAPPSTPSAPPDSHPAPPQPPEVDPLGVGRLVRLSQTIPYLKTADPMPMLRPADLIDPGETGVVVESRALGMRAVRFRRGTFLLEEGRLSPAPPETPTPR